MKERSLYLLLYLTFIPTLSSAQRIGYSYDASGNRIKREIVMPRHPAMAKQRKTIQVPPSFSDNLQEHLIKISPNPTDGVLQISITGLKADDKCSLGLYTTQGTQILRKIVKADCMEINISKHPKGVYLLQVTINSHSTTWKIIKTQ